MNKKISRQIIQWKPWTAMILVLIVGIVFLYQEPVIQGQKLAISDVKTQGLIFEKYRNDYQAEFGKNALWYPYIFCGMQYYYWEKWFRENKCFRILVFI